VKKNFSWHSVCCGLFLTTVFFGAVQTIAEEEQTKTNNVAVAASAEEKQSAEKSTAENFQAAENSASIHDSAPNDNDNKTNIKDENLAAKTDDSKNQNDETNIEQEKTETPKKTLLVDGIVLTETDPGVFEANIEKDKTESARKPLVVDGLVLTETERRVFELTNAERAKRGLPALRLDRRLMESARRQANWMARTGIFKHGSSGHAENIAMGQRSSLAVVMAWMNSSGHRQNMMNRGHGAIGIGSYRGYNGAMYWCQQFAR